MLRPNRLARRCWTGCVAAALLFVQLATAAYACPGTPSAERAAMAGMPCAEMMAGSVMIDADQPGLCFQHCQADAGQPPVDPAHFMALQAPALLQMFVRAPAPEARTAAPAWAAHARARDRAPPAPHSIHHCCYRL